MEWPVLAPGGNVLEADMPLSQNCAAFLAQQCSLPVCQFLWVLTAPQVVVFLPPRQCAGIQGKG